MYKIIEILFLFSCFDNVYELPLCVTSQHGEYCCSKRQMQVCFLRDLLFWSYLRASVDRWALMFIVEYCSICCQWSLMSLIGNMSWIDENSWLFNIDLKMWENKSLKWSSTLNVGAWRFAVWFFLQAEGPRIKADVSYFQQVWYVF